MSEQDISTQFRGEIESLIKQLQSALAGAIRGMDDRPAYSNWRTRNQDVEEFADVVIELGQTLL